MEKYYVIEKSCTIGERYTCYSIMDKMLFKTTEEAKSYIINSLEVEDHRNGKWVFNELTNSWLYIVELYVSPYEYSDALV